ncbi:MAG: polysaccharide deacetylase family protein [Kofleriaceae bacterium]
MAEGILALRIDDIGASSKEHLYYTKRWYSNWGVLRDRRLFGKWAPYREMTAADWDEAFRILVRFRSRITIGITAAWVEDDGSLIPFPEKFPREAAAIGEGLAKGLVEVANHGLTHCVLRDGRYRRRRGFGTNRFFHREFWDWVDAGTQFDQLRRAQEILTGYFKTPITTLVPPGNVYSAQTLDACVQLGIRTVNCERPKIYGGASPRVIGDDNVLPFHDRELVLFGTRWLEDKLRALPRAPSLFVRDL